MNIKPALFFLVGLTLSLGAQETKKSDPPFLFNTTNGTQMEAVLKAGPKVEIVYYTYEGGKIVSSGIIRVHDSKGNLIVDVNDKGEAVYGPGYSGNEAAKVFWKALANYYPEICKTRAAQDKPTPGETR